MGECLDDDMPIERKKALLMVAQELDRAHNELRLLPPLARRDAVLGKSARVQELEVLLDVLIDDSLSI